MTYASLLAVLTGAPDDDTMLETAAALAARHRAMLNCLPVMPVPDLAAADPWGTGFIAPGVAEAMVEATTAFVDRAKEKTTALAKVHGLETSPGEFGPRLTFCEPEIAPWLSLERELPVTDLTVLAASAGRGEGPWSGVLGETLMGCRAPVLIVHGGRSPAASTVLVAWNGSLEASRAVRAALPILAQARRVVIAQALPHGAEPDRPDAEALARHLRRHGIAQVEVLHLVGADVAEDLAAAARRVEAGLLVLGAFGHSRLRETFLGGVTQTLLQHKDGPDLLVAH